MKGSENTVQNSSEECSLSPQFSKFENNSNWDWLYHLVYCSRGFVTLIMDAESLEDKTKKVLGSENLEDKD